MSSTLTDLTAATTWSGTDLFYATVSGNSRKIAASNYFTRSGGILTTTSPVTINTGTAAGDQFIIAGDVSTGYANFWMQGTGQTYQIGVGNASETALGVADKFFIYDRDNTTMRFVIDGNANRIQFGTGTVLAWSNVVGAGGTTLDTQLGQQSANVLAQVNSTFAQTFRLYRTYTDSSNYERLTLQSGSGYFEITPETAGTGTDNIALRLHGAGTSGVDIVGTGTIATAPGSQLNILTADGTIGWFSIAQASVGGMNWGIAGAADQFSTNVEKGDAVMKFYGVGADWIFVGSNQNDGGGTIVDIIKFANQGGVHISPFTATPGSGSTAHNLLFGSAAIGIYFGSGVPGVSAAQGSIYLRTDGSSTSTRLYVNTTGSTTWTNVTTAA